MKRAALILSLLLLILGAGLLLLPYLAPSPGGGGITALPGDPAPEETLHLPVGEELVYNLLWRTLSAGQTTFSILEKVELNGRMAYHLRMATESGPLLDSVYSIRDRVDSFIDATSGHSLRFARDIREGTFSVYQARDTLDFDYTRMVALYQKTRFDKGGEPLVSSPPRSIPGPVQDTLSLLYSFRTAPLKPGLSRTVLIGTRKRESLLTVSIAEEKNLSLPGLGLFNALRLTLEPEERDGKKEEVKVFLSQGEVELWVEKETFIPLKLHVSGIPLLGSADAVLFRIKGGPLSGKQRPAPVPGNVAP